MNATPTALRGRRFPGEENLHVMFFTDAVQSELKTKEQGHPVFDDTEMIEIRVPGDSTTIIRVPVTNEYRSRFPDEYNAYKANAAMPETGTPLEQWAALSPSQIAQFKAQNIRTVEQLAEVADSNANFMGANELRTKAKAYLKTAQDAAIVEKQEAALEELRAEIAALKAAKSK